MKLSTPFEEIYKLFSAYKKLLELQNAALKKFDLNTYSSMHPEKNRLSKDYQQVVGWLIDCDLKQLKLTAESKQRLLKLVQLIQKELESQRKYLMYAQKTLSRVTDIYKNYVQQISLNTYASTGQQAQKRHQMMSLLEMS